MGSSGSKAARAAGSASRRYPPKPSLTTNQPSSGSSPVARNRAPGPTVHPNPSASSSRSEAIDLDAADPDFARSLRSLGAVQPNPTLSTSSHFGEVLAGKVPSRNPIADVAGNQSPSRAPGGPPIGPDPRNNPALAILTSRQRWQDEADKEFGEIGRRGFEGRTLVDVGTIRQALVLRDGRGLHESKVEEMLELKKGSLRKLGPKGIVTAAEMGVD